MKSFKRRAAVGVFAVTALASTYGSVMAQQVEIPVIEPQQIELNVEEIVEKLPSIHNKSSIEELIKKEKAEQERIEKEQIKAEKKAEQERIESEKKAEEERIAKEKEKAEQEKKAKMTDSEIAKLVIDGEYGNGDTRKQRLEQEGRSYEVIQNEVAKLTPKPEVKKESQSKVAVASTGQKAAPASNPAPAPTSQGRTMVMEATGYSTAQPSLSRYTANGTDLHTNPRVIAVDPSVIPLGSTVTVEGYGTYIAADTGGAIKGNRIDIHFPTVAGAMGVGRRSVKITVH